MDSAAWKTKLARRLSKQDHPTISSPTRQETFSTQSQRVDVETSEPIAKQESEATPTRSAVVPSTPTSHNKRNESSTTAGGSGGAAIPPSSPTGYETAAVEPMMPFPPISPTPTTLSTAATLVGIGGFGDHRENASDDEPDDDDSFLLSYYRTHGQKSFDEGKYDRAETLLTKALAVASGKPSNVADGDAAKRQISDAARRAGRGLEMNKACVDLCLLICRARRHQGKAEQAGMILAQACRYVRRDDGDDGQRLRSRIDLEAVRFYLEQGKQKGAEECCGNGLKAVKRRMRGLKGEAEDGNKEDEKLYQAFLEAKVEISKAKGETDEADAYMALLDERRKGGTTEEEDMGTDEAPLTKDAVEQFMKLLKDRDLAAITAFFKPARRLTIPTAAGITYLHVAVKFLVHEIVAGSPHMQTYRDPIFQLIHMGANVNATGETVVRPMDTLVSDLLSNLKLKEENSDDKALRRDSDERMDEGLFLLFQALSVNGAVGHPQLLTKGMHAALNHRLPRLAVAFIDAGADIYAVESGRWSSPMKVAFRKGLAPVVKRLTDLDPKLLENLSLEVLSEVKGESLICYAARSNYSEIVAWLADSDRGGHNADGRGWTALHWACRHRNLEMVFTLMGHPRYADSRSESWGGRGLVGETLKWTPQTLVQATWTEEEKTKLRESTWGRSFFMEKKDFRMDASNEDEQKILG